MRKVILLVVSVGVVLSAVAIFFILTAPARELTPQEKAKALAQIAGRKLNLNDTNAPLGDSRHKGIYVSFFYPAAAKIYHQMVNGKEVSDQGALEYFAFDLENPRANVVTEVISAPSSVISLSDYPAVRLRQDESSVYSQSQIKALDGTTGLSFDTTNDSGFEKTGFFLTGGKIYSFSVTSVDQQTATQLFNKMIQTLVFN